MPKSLNSVQLIGNLTRDPELRYTQSGRPVCDVGLATGRQWKTDTGEQKEETDFHRIVVWGKLGEICSQYLKKGQKAYFSGRLSTRKWTAQDGTEKQTTEIIASDMIMLSGGRDFGGNEARPTPPVQATEPQTKTAPVPASSPTAQDEKVKSEETEKTETSPETTTDQTNKEAEIDPEDIPF